MTRTRKVRAFQMAKELGLSFKEFQKKAAVWGVDFSSAQSSLEETEAERLLQALRAVAAAPQPTAPSPKTAHPAPVLAETAEPKLAASSTVVVEDKKVSQDTSSKSASSAKKEVAPTNGVPSTASASLKNATKSASQTPVKDVETAVELICHHSHTYPGDRVFVCGSLPELGEWEPEKAVELDGQEWPDWRASVKLPKGQPFEYKLLIKNDHGYFWETGENRVGVIEENPKLEIESFR